MIEYSSHNKFVVFINSLTRVGGSAGELIVAQDVAQHVSQHLKYQKTKKNKKNQSFRHYE